MGGPRRSQHAEVLRPDHAVRQCSFKRWPAARRNRDRHRFLFSFGLPADSGLDQIDESRSHSALAGHAVVAWARDLRALHVFVGRRIRTDRYIRAIPAEKFRAPGCDSDLCRWNGAAHSKSLCRYSGVFAGLFYCRIHDRRPNHDRVVFMAAMDGGKVQLTASIAAARAPGSIRTISGGRTISFPD